MSSGPAAKPLPLRREIPRFARNDDQKGVSRDLFSRDLSYTRISRFEQRAGAARGALDLPQSVAAMPLPACR